MSRCTGAARHHSQAANPRGPMDIFHTIGVMLGIQWGFAGRAGTLGEFGKFGEIQKFCEFHEFHDRCLGTGCAISR